MKTLISSVLVFFLIISPSLCQKVKPSTAKEIARGVYNARHPKEDSKITSLIPIGNDTLFYIVSIDEKGFVLISGERSAPPILGICSKGTYDPQKMPPALLYLLEKYKYGISQLREKKITPSKEVDNQWNNLLLHRFSSSKNYSTGTVLVDTEWGQQNGYDYYCPENCPAGCTAVAMAQILHYWSCRVDGTLNDYMWKDMHLDSPDLDNALLIHDCGVASDMNYDPDGSSTLPWKARDGFANYFGIGDAVEVFWRFFHLSQWQSILEDEIDRECPVLYSGGALLGGGHSWVIDGYDEYGNFHCNWGWYGSYNDFYSLGDFDPGGNGPFNQYESAIIHIIPSRFYGVDVPQLSDASFTYSANGYALSVPEAYGATSYEWITEHGTISGSGSSATLYSDRTTNVQVRAYNNRCEIYSSYASKTITINYGPISGSNNLCSSGSNYYIPNVPTGSSITWNNGPYIEMTSQQGSNPGTFLATGNGSSWISASVTVNNSSFTVPQINVWAGPAFINSISGPYTVSINQPYYFYTDPLRNPLFEWQYEWQVQPSYSNYYINAQYFDMATITFYDSYVSYTILARVSNECGTSYWVPKIIWSYSYQFSISPNPASEEVQVTISETNLSTNATINKVPEFNVQISDLYGRVYYTKKKEGFKFTLPVSNLKDGTYYIILSYDKEKKSLPLIVKH